MSLRMESSDCFPIAWAGIASLSLAMTVNIFAHLLTTPDAEARREKREVFEKIFEIN